MLGQKQQPTAIRAYRIARALNVNRSPESIKEAIVALKTQSAHALQQSLFAANHTQNAVMATRPSNPAAVFGAAAGVRFAASFVLFQAETRELEEYLGDLKLKANQIVNAAFPIAFSIAPIKS